MHPSENEHIENYDKQSKHRTQNTFLPYEDGRTLVACGYNVVKRKHELTKIQRKN